jgi:hypothetical protein
MIDDYPSGARQLQQRWFTMRILASSLLFLVTAAAAVSAAPAREETTERISYSGRAPAPTEPDADPANVGWVELASATPASYGREFIEVGADAGALTQLRLTAASGRPRIREVRVAYKDGGRRVFEVDKVLGAKQRPAYLDLHGAHELREIVVITDRRSQGSYLLEGNAGDTGVVAHQVR